MITIGFTQSKELRQLKLQNENYNIELHLEVLERQKENDESEDDEIPQIEADDDVTSGSFSSDFSTASEETQ